MGLAAALLLATHAASAADRVPTRLVWEGSVCGSERDFVPRVLRRNRTIRFVTSAEEVAVHLSIEQTPDGLDARVRIEAKGQPPVTRRIRSPDCDDALDAAALVVAIGVEGTPGPARRPRRAPRRRAAPPPPAAPAAPEAAPTAPAPPPEPTPAEARPEVAPVEAAPVEAPVEPAPPDPAPPPAAPAPEPALAAPQPPVTDGGASSAGGSLVLGAGLAAIASVGITPEPLLGGGVWVSAGWEREGVWAPRLVIDAVHQVSDERDEARGEAEFGLDALSLALCPLRLGSPTLELRPCVSAALGRLASDGGQTYSPRDRTRPFGGLGGSVSASVSFGMLELRAALGVSAPLQRDSFRFGPECAGAACEADVFHRVAPMIWTGALGAGLTPR